MIKRGSWPILPIFKYMQEKRDIDEKEMYRTFNMGLGLVMAVNEKDAEKTIKKLESLGEKAYLIGEVAEGEQEVLYKN